MPTSTGNIPKISQVLWTSELGSSTADGKPFKKESKPVTTTTSSEILNNPVSINPGEKEDLDELLGDFYNWVRSSSSKTKVDSKEQDLGNSNDKSFQEETSTKRRKFDPLGNDDLATKSNLVGGNEEKVDEDNLDGMDVTEQSLINGLNDKPCPSGFKRVPSGECKPKIKV